MKRLGGPDVIIIEADMRRAERGHVDEQRVGDLFLASAAVGDGSAEVDSVPENHGGHNQIEPRGAIALVFQGPIADFPLVMKKQRPSQGVAHLALAQSGIRAAA